MRALNCDEVEDLLGARALDALPDEEALQVDEHVQRCADHRQALAELARTVSMLALTVDEIEPSPDLRRKVLDAIAAPAGLEGQPRPAAVPGPVVVPLRRVPRKPMWAPRPALAAIAAALLLTVGTAIGYGLGRQAARPVPGAPVAFNFYGNAKAPGVQATLTYFKDRHQGTLAVTGLPRLGPGLVYEMWLLKDGRAVPEGIDQALGGQLVATMSGDLAQFDSIAITVEPGNQPVPTSQPILVGQFSMSSALARAPNLA